MNGSLSPELLAERLADIERQVQAHHRVPVRSSGSLHQALGHALVVLGTRLEGRPTFSPARLR